MYYAFKAHPTLYKSVNFRSRLEANWAAFFDIAGWGWQYEPYDLHGWTPDFLVTFPCKHSDCEEGGHKILIEVKPYDSVDKFAGHMCMDFPYGVHKDTGEFIPACASAGFGINTDVSYWEMCHGPGSAIYSVSSFFRDHVRMWRQATNAVQWKPNER